MAAVARYFKTNKSTIRTIALSEAEIRSRAAISANSLLANTIFNSRGQCMEKMENALWLWVNEMMIQNVPLSFSVIRDKALSLYYNFIMQLEEGDKERKKKFQAGKGWFENFKKRFKLMNMKLVEESIGDNIATPVEIEDREDAIINIKGEEESISCITTEIKIEED